MEGFAGEAVASGDIGIDRLRQEAGGDDEEIDPVGLARGRPQLPPSCGGIETRRDDLGIEADMPVPAARARDLFHIGENLRARRVFARPIVIRLEEEFVLPRQHIDEETGVGVVAPGAADLAGLFVDGEFNIAAALQHLGHVEAGHAGADNRNAERAIGHRIILAAMRRRPATAHPARAKNVARRNNSW